MIQIYSKETLREKEDFEKSDSNSLIAKMLEIERNQKIVLTINTLNNDLVFTHEMTEEYKYLGQLNKALGDKIEVGRNETKTISIDNTNLRLTFLSREVLLNNPLLTVLIANNTVKDLQIISSTDSINAVFTFTNPLGNKQIADISIPYDKIFHMDFNYHDKINVIFNELENGNYSGKNNFYVNDELIYSCNPGDFMVQYIDYLRPEEEKCQCNMCKIFNELTTFKQPINTLKTNSIDDIIKDI